MLAAFMVAAWFLLSGWLRVVWGDAPSDKSGRWLKTDKAELIDSAGVQRIDVKTIILIPGREVAYTNQHVYPPKCGDGIVNKLHWEADNPGVIQLRATAAWSLNYQFQPTDIPSGESWCGNVRYHFKSPVRQVLRVSPVRYDLNRGQTLPIGQVSKDLCATTTNGRGCLEPMRTMAQIEGTPAGERAKTIRSFVFGFLALAFALATRIGYFRIYTIFFPSKAAQRASGAIATGRDLDIDDLAAPLGTDFERRQRTEDLEELVAQAKAKADQLEKTKQQRDAEKAAEEKAILDELDEATKRVEELTKKMTETDE